MRDSLLNCGIYPNKTKLDNIEVFDIIDSSLINHFVRGVFDGDGSICRTILKSGKKHYCFSIAGSPRFLEILKSKIIKNTGVSSSKTYNAEGCDVIRWAGIEQISFIYNWMYKDATIFLERKRDRLDGYFKDIRDRGTSKYRGVAWHKTNEKWLSSISHNKKRINLGYYEYEKEAAMAYDKAVIKYHKPLYKLNFREV